MKHKWFGTLLFTTENQPLLYDNLGDINYWQGLMVSSDTNQLMAAISWSEYKSDFLSLGIYKQSLTRRKGYFKTQQKSLK